MVRANYSPMTMATVELASFGAVVAHLRATGCEMAVAQVLAPPGAPWLCLMVTLGPMESFGLRAALVANGELPAGALALMDNRIVLRQTLPLEGLLVTQLEEAI